MNSSVKALIIIAYIFISDVSANQEIFVPKNDQVMGIHQYEYANMWWQWAVSMSDKESPIRDKDGKNCGVNQIGPVWFLTGGYGSSKIKRKCSIPSDKYIFFPVINMLYYPPKIKKKISCASVKKGAALNNKYLKSFRVTIDGQDYLNPVFYRQSSKKCFDLIARKPNNTQGLEVYPSATDGYWIMLKPLSIGTHNLSFRAEYDQSKLRHGKMVQEIEYTLEIIEP